MGLRSFNRLSESQRRLRAGALLPERFWEYLARLDPALAGGPANPQALHLICPPDRAELHLRCPRLRVDRDFAFSLDLEDGGAGQLVLSFIIINDVATPRYDIDVDAQGRLTLLGTAGRNVPEEQRAMAAGLGPCQVRKGLGLFSHLLPHLEELGRSVGYVSLGLEALTYHNAVMYENHGFAYAAGYSRMVDINARFRPGGRLHARLDGATPFRLPEFAATARGRSWALHDGILENDYGDETLELKMVKVFGQDAGQKTFGV